MKELKVFRNEELGLEVRCAIIDGKEYFVGKDIADALGYNESRKAISRHCVGGIKHPIGVSTGKKADGTDAIQMVNTTFIPEGDMYRLYCTIKTAICSKI